MRRVFMILLLMAAMITVFVGACAEDDDPFPILVVDGLPVTARVYPFHFGNETPNPTDEDLRNVKNAKWTWSMDMDVPQDAKIVNYPSRKPDGRILSPYVTFEGKNGISGTLTYSFSRSEGTEKSISYQFVDSELTYNRKLDKLPNLTLDRSTGDYILTVQPGDVIEIENFLTPQSGREYVYSWELVGSSGPEALAVNKKVQYTVKDSDRNKAIQFIIQYKDANENDKSYSCSLC